jgi:putative nucleotidyltransferase with HDIG domain
VAVPDLARARDLLTEFELPAGIVRHSEGVRAVATAAARLVADAGVTLDERLVQAAALLHDVDKPEIRTRGGEHGLVGAARLAELGYPELGPPVASHPLGCLLDDERFPRGWASVIVAIADRHVAQSFVTVDERLDDMIRRHAEHRASIEAARRPAQALEHELADLLELPVDAVVERLRAAWQCDPIVRGLATGPG